VVVPFYEYDASELATRLSQMAAQLSVSVEIVFADDGSPSKAGAAKLAPILTASAAPCLLLEYSNNMGRAAIRNQLANIARGKYLLFMDCDMMPDASDFLEIYADIAQADNADIIYGGRSAKLVSNIATEFDLHRIFTERRETLSAAERNAQPAYHFYSCNFLVKRSVILAVPINEQFKGWGWEDCEWAARASEEFSLKHIDNPATHLGLLTPAKILMKYEESLGNFSLMLKLRPEMIVSTSLYKAARLLKMLHTGWLVKAAAKRVAVTDGLPVGMRIGSMMWFKAALYSRLV
jgi:glycosyltransferase involved in cell wall biosynthesis